MRKAIAISTLIIALSAHAFGAMSDAVKMGAEKMNSGSAMRTVERIGDAGQTDTSFEMDPALSIRVASGAKIELDYTGTNEIASLRLAGRRVTGIVGDADVRRSLCRQMGQQTLSLCLRARRSLRTS